MGMLGRLLNTATSLVYVQTSGDGYNYSRYGLFGTHRISNPEIARTILQDTTGFQSPAFAQTILKRGLGDGLLSNRGPTWKRDSQLITPLLNPGKSQDLNQIAVEQAAAMSRAWKEHSAPVNVDEQMRFLTVDVICRALFGERMPFDIAKKMQDAVSDLNFVTPPSSRELFLNKNFGLPILSIEKPSEKEVQAIRFLDQFIYGKIDERRQQGRERPHDILDHLIAYKDTETGEGLDNTKIRDHLVTLFFAGHETTATGLTFAISELAKRPDIVNAVHDEVQSATGGGPVDVSHLRSLKLTGQVFMEALRLHPPVFSIPRECIEPRQIEGINFKEGDIVRIRIDAMNRDAQQWEAPHFFNPKRFDAKGLLGRVFLPFSRGERVCPGQSLSMIEAVATLANICRDLRLHLMFDSHEKLYGITARPREPIVVWPEPRSPS